VIRSATVAYSAGFHTDVVFGTGSSLRQRGQGICPKKARSQYDV
jgi:hypothetical protein